MADAVNPTGNDGEVVEKIAFLLTQLPKPVRDFVESRERTDIALALSQKYQLHVDQAGVFERSFLHMLIGIASPVEFVEDLREAGISEETITGLANDLNDQVFKKLRRQEQEIGQAPQPATPPSPQAPATAAPTPAPAPVAPPPLPAPEPPAPEPMRTMQADMAHIQGQYQAPPQYAPMYQPMQQVQYVPFGYAPIPMQQPGGYWVPVVMPQQIQAPMQAPASYPQPQYQPPVPPPPAPAPVPVHEAPVPPLPPAPPAAEPEPTYTPPPPVRSAAPPPNLPRFEQSAQEATPLRKEYSVDPYREPI